MEWRIYSCCPTFDKTRNLSSRKWDPIKIQQFQAYAFESTFDLNQAKPGDSCSFSWKTPFQMWKYSFDNFLETQKYSLSSEEIHFYPIKPSLVQKYTVQLLVLFLRIKANPNNWLRASYQYFSPIMTNDKWRIAKDNALCHWQIVNRNSTFSNHIGWIQNTKFAIDKKRN